MKTRIYNCKKNDLKKLAKVYFETYTKALPNENWTFETAFNFIKFQFKQSDCFFIAKTEDGHILGATFGYMKPFSIGNCFMLEEVFINPNYQANGVGTKLLNYLFNHLKNYEIKQVMATTYENENNQPLKWYLHNGFKKCDLTVIEANLEDIKI